MKMIATTIKLACISPSVSTPAQSVQTEIFSIPKYESKRDREREIKEGRERRERKTINQVVYRTFRSTLKTFFGSMLMGKHSAREKK